MAYYYSPFRKSYNKPRTGEEGCPFCNPQVIKSQAVHRGNKLVENKSYVWMVNVYPKFEGHTMLVPKRHITEVGRETSKEVLDREKLLVYAAKTLRKLFKNAGIEVFLQTGSGSEASVAHLHWHLVPASPKDPLRSFDKLGHFYTVKPREKRVVLTPIRIRRSPKKLLEDLSRIA